MVLHYYNDSTTVKVQVLANSSFTAGRIKTMIMNTPNTVPYGMSKQSTQGVAKKLIVRPESN